MERTIVKISNMEFDLTNFKYLHPGGEKIIEKYNNKDISDIFYNTTYHSNIVKISEILEKYIISENNNQPKIENDKIIYKTFEIDLKKGIIGQVIKLNDEEYKEIIKYPITKKVKLFTNNFLDSLTKTNPNIIFIWIPISIMILIYSIIMNNEKDKKIMISIKSIIFAMISYMTGIMIWILSEYIVHRYIFHMSEILLKNKILRIIHFVVHGFHHLIPKDKNRLVFPPWLAVMIFMLAYNVIEYVINYENKYNTYSLMAGFILGYTIYDYSHCKLHQNKNKYDLNYINHIYHHYGNHDKNFGVSTNLYDLLFDTQ